MSLALVFSLILLRTDFLDGYLIKFIPFFNVFSLLAVWSFSGSFRFLKQKPFDFLSSFSTNC